MRQNLKNLILTDPGERIMVPNFGAGIRRLLFEPMNSVVRGKVTSRIISQVSEYMGFVQISDIIVLTSENDPDLGPNTVRLVVKYNLGNVNDSDTLIITQNQY